MNDTVTKLMELADNFAAWAEAKGEGHPTYVEARKELQDELVKLFTPLSETEPIYKCKCCGHIYQDAMSSCDCTVSAHPDMVAGIATFPPHGITGESNEPT